MFELLYVGSIFCALLTIFLLLFKENAIKSYSNYLLSSILLLEVYFVAIYLLIYSGLINNFPFLYKTAAPLNFLIPPFAFLYVKSVITNKKGLQIKEYSHFLPFLLALINYLPFFLLPIEQKNIIVQLTSKDLNYALQYQAGLFPESTVFLLKLIQSIIYLILQWRLITQFKKDNLNKTIEDQIRKVIKWLRIFTGIFTSIFIGFLFLALLFYVTPLSLFSILFYNGQSLLLSASFFLLSSYLLIHPGVLDGMPFIKYLDSTHNFSNQKESKQFILENYEPEINKLEEYMIESFIYLNPKVSLTLISASLDIPIKDLSFIINNHFKLRFNDYINKYRVDYFIKMIDEAYLEKFTIDALIQKAGFSSKATFHSAFKKIHNCTPSQFISKAGV